MPVQHGLIIEVMDTKVIKDYERYAPEVKLGNLKDEEKIKQKKEEAKERFKAEAAEHPLLADVTYAHLHSFSVEDPSDGTGYVFKGEFPSLIEFFDDIALSTVCVFGIHPTTHMRLLQNTIIRRYKQSGIETELWGRLFNPQLVQRVNVWRDVCPSDKDVDWQRTCCALGLAFDDSLEATHCILQYQGYVEYMRGLKIG